MDQWCAEQGEPFDGAPAGIDAPFDDAALPEGELEEPIAASKSEKTD